MRDRFFLLGLVFFMANLGTALRLDAQCASVMFNSSDTGDVIRLDSVTVGASQMNASANYWAACPAYGLGFPKFTTNNVSAAMTVTVVHVGGIGDSCGLATLLSATLLASSYGIRATIPPATSTPATSRIHWPTSSGMFWTWLTAPARVTSWAQLLSAW